MSSLPLRKAHWNQEVKASTVSLQHPLLRVNGIIAGEGRNVLVSEAGHVEVEFGAMGVSNVIKAFCYCKLMLWYVY